MAIFDAAALALAFFARARWRGITCLHAMSGKNRPAERLWAQRFFPLARLGWHLIRRFPEQLF